MKHALFATVSAVALGAGAAAVVGLRPRRNTRRGCPQPPRIPERRPEPRRTEQEGSPEETLRKFLMYFIVPLWTASGVADWICHFASDVETTTGPKESLIHILMLTEAAVPTVAGLFLEITAPVLGLMITAFLLHQVTAYWDVSYAVTRRDVTPIEQHVHSYLEMVPLMAVSFATVLHWPQFLSLAGLREEPADMTIRLKRDPLPTAYIATVLSLLVLLEGLPYLVELGRGLWINDGHLVPDRG